MEQTPTRKSRQSSGQYAQQTIIELHSSNRHRILILLAHSCAAGLLPWATFPIGGLVISSLFITASLFLSLQSSGSTGIALSLRQAGNLYLRAGVDAEWQKAVMTSAFVAGWLIVLTLSGRRRVVCFPDSMEKNDFRRLLVFIRLHGPARHQAGQLP